MWKNHRVASLPCCMYSRRHVVLELAVFRLLCSVSGRRVHSSENHARPHQTLQWHARFQYVARTQNHGPNLVVSIQSGTTSWGCPKVVQPNVGRKQHFASLIDFACCRSRSRSRRNAESCTQNETTHFLRPVTHHDLASPNTLLLGRHQRPKSLCSTVRRVCTQVSLRCLCARPFF